jgi:F-type H+-transporting ATPase subunit a
MNDLHLALGHPEPTWLHPLAVLLEPYVPYAEFVTTTLFIILGLTLIVMLATRNLRKNAISRHQALWELIVQGMVGFVEGIMGPNSRRFVPLIGTIFIFLMVANLFGIIPGFNSPSSSLNTTVALALVVFVVVQFEGIRAHGFGSYVKHFAGEPIAMAPLMFPMHVIGEFAKPLSLCIRLAGNIFAEDSVIIIFAALSPFLYMFLKVQWAKDIPLFPTQILIAPLMIFFGMIQALVFTMLSTIYIAAMAGEGQEEMPTH